MSDTAISPLQAARAHYNPKLPAALRQGNFGLHTGDVVLPQNHREEIARLFPNTYGQALVRFAEGGQPLSTSPLCVGVVLSGGPAPGGHNVIAGLFDALKQANPASRLYGFRKGPIGVIKGNSVEITAELVDRYRNTGGFDMIMSGRDKIESPEQLAACKANLESMGLDGLVVVGGDDSNTNAAVLAEYLKSQQSRTVVVGVPKTIDGDMKNEQIEASFGFDTATKTFAELIGNIERDAQSSIKYWHFIRLMGRAASHVTLECALQTRPNITLISEEIKARGMKLSEVAAMIGEIVIARAQRDRHYGVVLVPEGLLEFIPEFKKMIDEISTIVGGDKHNEEYLNSLEKHEDRVQFMMGKFSAESARVYASLPFETQRVLLRVDKHGNPPLSQVETERLLIDLVIDYIREQKVRGVTDVAFNPLSHFMGYEGRCAAPSNFDADYCYSLGYTAAQLVRAGLTGYTVSISHLVKPAEEWVAGATPVTTMLNMETRKGKSVPVIRKALVEIDSAAFQAFAAQRDAWALDDAYTFPGPIQYFGPSEVCDKGPITLQLERGQ